MFSSLFTTHKEASEKELKSAIADFVKKLKVSFREDYELEAKTEKFIYDNYDLFVSKLNGNYLQLLEYLIKHELNTDDNRCAIIRIFEMNKWFPRYFKYYLEKIEEHNLFNQSNFDQIVKVFENAKYNDLNSIFEKIFWLARYNVLNQTNLDLLLIDLIDLSIPATPAPRPGFKYKTD